MPSQAKRREEVTPGTPPPTTPAAFPGWWGHLCRRLRALQQDPGYIRTPVQGVRNEIIRVNEAEGYLDLRSARSPTGKRRRIPLGLLLQADSTTTHGVIVRYLRALADEAEPPSAAWRGPCRLQRLFERCLDDDLERPAAAAAAYLVSAHSWTGDAPTPACHPLHLGAATGAPGRLRTGVGDLVADLLGFFDERTAPPSGGQALHAWCRRTGTEPGRLFLSWLVDPTGCGRCRERTWYERLRPLLNGRIPPACPDHGPTREQGWEALWGRAGTSEAEEADAITRPIVPDPALERALR